MLIVFIGPPGAGKGTQCKLLVDHFEIPHLSTGEMLRHAKQQGTQLGRIAAPIMDRGELVPDHLVIGIISERLNHFDCDRGALLDGFPRTIRQAESLDLILSKNQRKVDAVVELFVSDEELRRRLLQRYHQLPDPRPEDQPEAIPTRLKVYRDRTLPLLDYYQKKKNLHPIDGIGEPQVVFERILRAIDPERIRR
jgi:adenylate kinase